MPAHKKLRLWASLEEATGGHQIKPQHLLVQEIGLWWAGFGEAAAPISSYERWGWGWNRKGGGMH